MKKISNRRVVEYTTYRIPKNIRMLIITLAVLLTLSIAINIYIVFAGQKSSDPILVTVPERITTTEEEETVTTTTQHTRYYDAPLAEDLQDFIRFCLDDDEISNDISLSLVLAMIEVESDYQSDVISETNDYGLMQINIINHDWLAEQHHLTDMLNPYQNIEAGIIILNDCMNNSPNMHAALTAYNRGLGGAQELWEQGIYETEYSRKVLDAYERIRRTK